MFNLIRRWLGLAEPAIQHHDPFNYKSIAYQSNDLTIHFSPQGGCTEIIVAELVQAKQEILVLAYIFTSQEIAHALLAAHDRGVDVQVIVDVNEAPCRGSQVETLKKEIKVYTDSYHAIAHNKIIVIDQKTVVTGSFNYTAAAEHVNAENLVVLRNPDVCTAYLANFHAHLAHSLPA
jgi:phosphatidylserine/phosphatidylglycerophosphate/cardiolipin synthase-like enzyme